MSRNFICPMTSEPCANGGCTTAHCCEHETLKAIRIAHTDQRARQRRWYELEERSRESLRKLLRGKPKISN